MTERFRFIASRPRHVPPVCDCHTHVFGPTGRYPFAEDRSYTPKDAVVEDAKAMMRTLEIERIVLVQPSPYRTDNRRPTPLSDRVDRLPR